MSELKPCPFCGSTNIDRQGWASTDRSGPACDNCSGSADTVAIWNERPAENLLRARVAEMEEESASNEKVINSRENDIMRLSAHIDELVTLLIQVVHCGGQCSAELLAKIERATQEEAGWTEKASSTGLLHLDGVGDGVVANPIPATTIISSSSSEEAKIIEPRPAQSPTGAAWQPIATAPKDGTEILCWVPHGSYAGILISRWKNGYWWETSIMNPPTKWMALPLPPDGAAPRMGVE